MKKHFSVYQTLQLLSYKLSETHQDRPNSVDKEIVDSIAVSFCDPSLLCGRSTSDYIPLKFVRLKQVGNLPGVENVVDVFQKFLHHNLCHNERIVLFLTRNPTVAREGRLHASVGRLANDFRVI